MIRLLLLSFLVLNVVSGCHRPAKSAGNEAHGVQAVLDSLVNVNQVPGVSYAIVFEDKTIKSYSSGYADVHQRTLMTSEHVMFSGSVGKTYAVALLMQLLDEGLFALEDRIIDYFPDFNSIFAYYPELQVSVALQGNCDYASQKIPLIDYLNALIRANMK